LQKDDAKDDEMIKPMKRIALITLLLFSSTVFADGPAKQHRRLGRPCGKYTVYIKKKKHYREGRPCGHKIVARAHTPGGAAPLGYLTLDEPIWITPCVLVTFDPKPDMTVEELSLLTSWLTAKEHGCLSERQWEKFGIAQRHLKVVE